MPTSVFPGGDQTSEHIQSLLGHRDRHFQRLYTSWAEKKITGSQHAVCSSCKYTALNAHLTFSPTFSWLGIFQSIR